jgi:hypothetical protein
MNEPERRDQLWQELVARGGPTNVAPRVLRDLRLYGGAQGIWVDKATTAASGPDGHGATVAVLHTGRHYPDDLQADRIVYHYPNTTRRGRDDAEVQATKNAAALGLLVFVITETKGGLKNVTRGTITGCVDELAVFQIALDVTPSAPQAPAALTGAPGATVLGIGYREANEATASVPRDAFTIDPNKIDRGLRGHATTQNALAALIRSRGLSPLSPTSATANYDLAWEDTNLYVAEVKSLTAQNQTQQLRLGLGQVLDYRALLQAPSRTVIPVLAVEMEPTDKRWKALCDSLDVILTWPPEFPGL